MLLSQEKFEVHGFEDEGWFRSFDYLVQRFLFSPFMSSLFLYPIHDSAYLTFWAIHGRNGSQSSSRLASVFLGWKTQYRV